MRPSRLGLLLVLAVAAALRFWALGHGIPHALSVDEPEIVERALRMMKTGTLNPHFFDYGQLVIYIQFLVSIVRFIAGSVTGAWDSLSQVTSDSFYLWGRAVTAAFGVATVLVVFRIGLRWGARHALLAAALMALMPLHVRYSHYVLTDIPLTFFVAMTMLMALSAHERPGIRTFAWAGAMAGLAAAVKYNGGLALLMPLMACWMTPARTPVTHGLHARGSRRGGGGVLSHGALHDPGPTGLPRSLRQPDGRVPQWRTAGRTGHHHLPEAPAPAVRAARDAAHYRRPDHGPGARRGRTRTSALGGRAHLHDPLFPDRRGSAHHLCALHAAAGSDAVRAGGGGGDLRREPAAALPVSRAASARP